MKLAHGHGLNLGACQAVHSARCVLHNTIIGSIHTQDDTTPGCAAGGAFHGSVRVAPQASAWGSVCTGQQATHKTARPYVWKGIPHLIGRVHTH